MIFFCYLLIGLLAGLLSGFLGIGGGIVIVPALIEMFSWQQFSSHYLMQIATATSLATIVITTVMVTWSHHQRNAVRWDIFPDLIPGMVLGVLLGVWGGKYLPTAFLKMVFAVFALGLGLKILWQAHHLAPSQQSLSSFGHFFVSLFIGGLSGMLGIGGGLLIVPLLLWRGLSMPQVSGTSVACVLPTALIGMLTAVIVGWNVPGLPPHSLGFVNWPAALILGLASLVGAPLGVHLVHMLSPVVTKRAFGFILIFIALKILVI